MLNCVLISADESFRRQILNLVRSPDGPARVTLDIRESAAELSRQRVAQILASDPHVVFVDLGESVMGVRVIEALGQEAPDVSIVAAGPSLPAENLLQIIRAGASEYLPRPFSDEETAAAFQRVRRRSGLISHEDSSVRGRVMTLFSPKGGVGVTTLSVNLAVALRQLTEKSVLLLDLAPSLGTAALSMGLQPRYSYLDAIQNFHRIDEELFRSFLQPHEAGVHVLASPPRADDVSGPSMDEVMGVLRLCRRHFAYVVVDGGHLLTSAVDTALLEAEQRIFVTTPELPTLRNLKRTLELLSEHSVNGKAPPRLVLNQHEDGVGVSVHDVENGLGLAVDTIIEREPSIIESINLGRPAVMGGRSRFTKSVMALGRELAGPDHVVVQRGGFMDALLRPFRSSPAGAKEGRN